MVNRSEKNTGCEDHLETHGDGKIWEPMGLLMADKIHPDVWGSVGCQSPQVDDFGWLSPGVGMCFRFGASGTSFQLKSLRPGFNATEANGPDGNCWQAILKDRAEMQEKREMYCTSMETDICYLLPFNYFRSAALLEKLSHFTVAIVCKLNWPRRMDGTGQHWISVKMILIRIIQVKV